jgi:hypothetical protein
MRHSYKTWPENLKGRDDMGSVYVEEKMMMMMIKKGFQGKMV